MTDALVLLATETRLKTAFSRELRERFANVRLAKKIHLVKDLPGYRVAIHHDTFSKVMTAQFYRPAAFNSDAIGTGLYLEAQSQGFALAKKVRYTANHDYAFPVTHRSWHGVDWLPASERERNSLMLIYFLDGQVPA